jgi:transcriptional regulator with XRE-family HTH domain
VSKQIPTTNRGKRALFNKVEAIRVQQDWDDEELGELLGCTGGAISKWRAGVHTPSRHHILDAMVSLVECVDLPSPSQQRRLDNGLVQLNVPVTPDTRAKLRLISAMQGASYADILTAHIEELYKKSNVDEVVKLAKEIK